MEPITKEYIRKVILNDIERSGSVYVTNDILAIGFAELSAYSQGVTLFAFTIDKKPVPPLTYDEQIDQFCQTNNLTFKPFENRGYFEKLAMNNDIATPITNLEYSIVETHAWDTNPVAITAHRDPGLFLYRITFTYEGHNAIMLTLLSKEMVEDSAMDLEDVFRIEAELWIKENPPAQPV